MQFWVVDKSKTQMYKRWNELKYSFWRLGDVYYICDQPKKELDQCMTYIT